MAATNVRVTALIKLLVQMMSKKHYFVDIEFIEPNTLKVYPSLPPVAELPLGEGPDQDAAPLDDQLLGQLI